jgi:hypothetical protein
VASAVVNYCFFHESVYLIHTAETTLISFNFMLPFLGVDHKSLFKKYHIVSKEYVRRVKFGYDTVITWGSIILKVK